MNEILQLVSFIIDGEEYAVNILNVQEINRVTEITKVPNLPDYIEGIINLRGKVIPIINLRKKLGIAEKEADDISRIIIMDIHAVLTGLLVDSVLEVLRVPSDSVDPVKVHYVKGVAILEGRRVMLVDMEEIVPEPIKL